MFYDERIEGERGRITRNAIRIATLFALASAVLRGVNIMLNMGNTRPHSQSYYFLNIMPESIIAATGVICLTVGLLRSLVKPRDERFAVSQANFYKRAGVVALLVSLAGYSYFLPFSLFLYTNINFVDVTSGSTVYQLFLLLITYLVYAFKKREIYFNYAIIESEHYPYAVLRNIGKLGLGSLACLALSLCGTVVGDQMFPASSRTVAILISCLLEHTVLFVLLALLYAVFSLLERVSFQKRRLLSGSTLVTLLAVILFQAFYSIIWGVISSSGLPLMEAVTVLSGFLWVPEAAMLALVIFIIYYDSEYRGRVSDRFTKVGTLCLLLSEVAGSGLIYLFTLVRNILIDRLMGGNIRFYSLYNDLLSYIKALIHITFLVGFALLILGPVRRRLASKGHIAAVVLSFAAFGVQIFLYSQSSVVGADVQETVNLSLSLLRYLYLAVFLFLLSRGLSKDSPLTDRAPLQ